MNLEALEKIVESRMSEKRFKHSKFVMKRCKELAIMYGEDTEIAEKIGIAHDIAKEMTDEEKLEYINKNNLFADEIELLNPGLLHAKIGASIVERELDFTSRMAEAISSHTTGKPNMDLLAKILFVADSTGEERNWEGVEKVRKISETDLDLAILYIIDEKIKKNINKGNLIHPDSILTRNLLMIQLHNIQKIG